MKISMICFSLSGSVQMERLKEAFQKEGDEVTAAARSRYLEDPLRIPLRDWCEEQFASADGIVFIGAAGIAVRSIAPFVSSKKTDPAVVVVDELGTWAISLLSGHLGGANDLAARCAGVLKARPVITTATDLHGYFAVDVFAKKNQMTIHNMAAARDFSAALLAGEPAGFYSAYPLEGELPRGLILCGRDGLALDGSGIAPETGAAITTEKDCRPFSRTVTLVPRTLILGLGCRRGKEAAAIRQAVDGLLERHSRYPEALKCAASADRKADEEGILAFCQERELPFYTYSAEELLAAPGEFTPSEFVRETLGVDNVCERGAVCAGGSRWLERKRGADGITTALAEEDRRITF